MKEKKNIILLIFALIFFVIALIFFMWSFFGEHNTNIQIGDIIGNNSILQKNEDINKNSDVNEVDREVENSSDNEIDNSENTEVSNTQDVENVSYTDITVYGENNTEVSLSQYAGKPVMLLFWSPENEDSIEVLKKVNEMYNKYTDKVEFLMVSILKDIPEALKNEISMEIYYDLNSEYQTKYNIETIPTMLYIDKENSIMNAKSGIPSTDAIEANLDILSDNI